MGIGTGGRRTSDLLALNRNVVLLLAAIILIGAGEELWTRFLPKYLEALGASTLIIGTFDALKTLLGAVYAYPGGVAVDRWGHRRAFVAFTVVSLFGYLLLLLVPHWAAVLAGMFLFLAWNNLSLPATFTLIADALPANRHTMGIGIQSLVRRIPVLVGPVAGGWLMDRFGLVSGVRMGVAISILLSASALLMQHRIQVAAPALAHQRSSWADLWQQAPSALRRLLLSDILIRFCERIPFAWVVIHLMNNLGLGATEVGVLIGIEMAAAILCYVPVAHYADRFGKEPFVIATFVFFTMFPVTLAFATKMPSPAMDTSSPERSPPVMLSITVSTARSASARVPPRTSCTFDTMSALFISFLCAFSTKSTFRGLWRKV